MIIFSKMKESEAAQILQECQRLFPEQFQRLSERYPRRQVMLILIDSYPEQLCKVIERLFIESDEYREAMRHIERI
jgi:hypothetical protein